MRGKLRAAARLLAVGGLVVLLTGCMKVHEDLTLNPDDTVDGSVVFAVDKQLLSMTGTSFDDFLNQASATDAPLPSGVPYETQDYSDDKYVGKEYTFSGAPLSAFNDPSGELSITREGDQFKVSGNLDMTSGAQGIDPNDPTTKQLLSSFDVQISITFPGAVDAAQTTGTIDGNTVTWTPKFGDNLKIEAVGSAIASGGSSSALIWILLGVVVVIVVIVAVILLGKRGKGAPTAPTGFGDEGAVAAAGMPAAPVEEAAPAEEGTSIPEPPAVETAPMPTEPEPSATEPISPPSAAEPEPATEPLATEPEPPATEPEPSATGPEPPATEPIADATPTDPDQAPSSEREDGPGA